MQGFIGDPAQAIFSLVAIDVWLYLPFVAIILLAGLQTLPQEQIDAAHIDGASEWQLFWQIKLPILVPFYIVALFFRVIDSLNVFDTHLRHDQRRTGRRDAGARHQRLRDRLPLLQSVLRRRDLRRALAALHRRGVAAVLLGEAVAGGLDRGATMQATVAGDGPVATGARRGLSQQDARAATSTRFLHVGLIIYFAISLMPFVWTFLTSLKTIAATWPRRR